MKVELGPAEDFQDTPALVEIGSGFYYLTRRGEKWRLLSTLCPHAGGEVVWREDEGEFVCPLHGWRFDRRGRMDGGCPGLKVHRVRERKGRLWVDL